MSRYWELVPRGTWQVVDPVDAIDALRDQESRGGFDQIHNRINVFGPESKSLIINLAAIRAHLGAEDYKDFLALAYELLGGDYKELIH